MEKKVSDLWVLIRSIHKSEYFFDILIVGVLLVSIADCASWVYVIGSACTRVARASRYSSLISEAAAVVMEAVVAHSFSNRDDRSIRPCYMYSDRSPSWPFLHRFFAVKETTPVKCQVLFSATFTIQIYITLIALVIRSFIYF